MKRVLLVAVAGFIIGKIVVGAILSLSHTSAPRTGHFNFDKSLDEYRRLAPIPDAAIPQFPPAPATPMGGRPVYDPKAATVALNGIPRPVVDEKKAEVPPVKDTKAEDEKKRRKKRKKKLEEMAAQMPERPTPTVAVQAPTQIPQAPVVRGFSGPFDPDTVPSHTTAVPNNNSSPYTFGRAIQPVNINGYRDALVHRPTTALMKSFIALYQKKQITDGQFYQVLSAMEKSSVLTARQFAIQAAQLQQRFESYLILAEESQGEPDPTLKAMANKAAQSYATPNELSILSEGLSNSSSLVKLESAELLKVVVQGLANNKNIAQMQSMLSPFIPILTQIAKEPGSPADLQANASAVLLQITSLLGIASA